MNEMTASHKLQRTYKLAIKTLPREKKEILKSQFFCGARVVHMQGAIPAVYVVANDQDAQFFGTITCKNPWACPICAPKKMSEYATKIACAIDALKLWHKQSAAMLTFTIPHTRGMSCEETTQILKDTWSAFIIHGKKRQHVKYYANDEKKYKHGQKKVLTVSSKKQNDAFSTFCENLNCKHHVRVGEYTYGEHGWHPHFHCLFWVDSDKLQEIKNYREQLNERWLTLAKRCTLKLWNKLHPENCENNQKRVDIMYSKADTVGSKGCYISVDKNDNIIEQKSSMYICGWGADRELTGNVQHKASNAGHKTPFQILEEATETGEVELLNLYLEYALATKKMRNRVKFSHKSGIREIIQKWQHTQTYQENMKKKASELAKKDWRVVCCFNEQNWFKICKLDEQLNIKHQILELANASVNTTCEIDNRQLIASFLYEYDIQLADSPLIDEQAALIEQIFNKYRPQIATAKSA